jgi:hypothetical protein
VEGLLADGVPCTTGTPPVDGVPCIIGVLPADGVPCTIGTSFAGTGGSAISSRMLLCSCSCSLSSLVGGFELCWGIVLSPQSVLVSWGDESGRGPVGIVVTALTSEVFKGCPQDPQKRAW